MQWGGGVYHLFHSVCPGVCLCPSLVHVHVLVHCFCPLWRKHGLHVHVYLSPSAGVSGGTLRSHHQGWMVFQIRSRDTSEC